MYCGAGIAVATGGLAVEGSAAKVYGDTVFGVCGVHAGREADVDFGTYRTREAAQAAIAELLLRADWVREYHNRGFVIREIRVTTDFELPPLPRPRERFCTATAPLSNGSGVSASLQVDVFERGAGAQLRPLAHYVRNHAAFHAFEPFRQGARHYALIARDYTRSAVLDLGSGEVIAEEAETDPPGCGFCPVGFYVPDWWDIHDGSVIPGSPYWNADREWPDGRFGLVWGCVWGDDSSWKVEYLDLSRISEGLIQRDARFGYLELATTAYRSPAHSIEPPPDGASAPPFIRLWRSHGKTSIRFHVAMDFDLESGSSGAWQRCGDPFD